ncbi:MAG: ice-binding family protein [Patescibacteria group bacterium]|nr:ice-binding family protein [Patescibacteria group bacterium]
MTTSKLFGFTFLAATLLSGAPVYAASNPSLGQASTFTVLSGTYSNTTAGTTLTGDLGYTTPPVTSPTVNGSTHVADAVYNQAGIDQGTALTNLNNQPCSFSFAPGAVDLASDTTHGVVGVYTPGIYCINGAASIGGGGTITLTGAGTYIFRTTGALTSTANSKVAVAGGASVCNVWWTPGAATTLGANSTFGGTIIDASGITIGNTVNWAGRALAFGGTVSTDIDTVSSAGCATATTATTPSTATKLPGLPNTGGAPLPSSSMTQLVAPLATISALTLGYFVRKRSV